jgi:exosortase F-associated protein
MLQKILSNKIRLAQFLFLVGLLILIRAFEDKLFYDPFLDYFKNDFANLPLPNFIPFQLFFGLLFRFTMNTVLSLGIIYLLFKDVQMVKFALVMYYFFFMILIITFFFIIYYVKGHNNLALFYVRRFLIQPIFLLLFVPAFYYQKQK